MRSTKLSFALGVVLGVAVACVPAAPMPCTVCGDACVDVKTDSKNCGGCGNACPAGTLCSAAVCQATCPPGQALCGTQCVDTAADPKHCGACGSACDAGMVCGNSACAISCPTGQAVCGGSCRSLDTDPKNCGACGRTCDPGKTCVSGSCVVVCLAGQKVCGGRCVDVQTDNAHCGACDSPCDAGLVCSGGACGATCGAPFTRCGAGCADPRSDVRNCNGCGNVCAAQNATPTCVAGACNHGACAAGFSDCDGLAANGCETATSADVSACGACGRVCHPVHVRPAAPDGGAGGADAGSDGGTPACGGLPDGGDAGACPYVPPAGTVCRNSACAFEACEPGFGDCDGFLDNGCETPLNRNDHCGTCGNACALGFGCSSGVCRDTRSIASPGGTTAVLNYNLPRPVDVVLAAPPPAGIFYTLDGTAPVAGQPGTFAAGNTVTLDGGSAYQVRWFAAYPDGAREADDHVLTYGTPSGAAPSLGMIVDHVQINGGGPLAIVSPGATVSVSAQTQYWRSSSSGYCPGCVLVPTVGVDGIGQQWCPGNYTGGVYPGTSQTVTFSFAAPITPGRYFVRSALQLVYNCSQAGGGSDPVGLVIVQ